MKRITINKCDHCGFTGTTKEVRLHEVTCNDVAIAQKKKEVKIKKMKDYANSLRLEAETVKDFAKAVEKYIKDTTGEDFSISITVDYNMFCSGSHSHPINASYIPYDYNMKYPNYPGLYGDINLIKAKKSGDYCGDYIKNIPGLNSGSGGGGYDAHYQLTLFLEDFPKIKAKVNEAMELELKKQSFTANEIAKENQLQLQIKEVINMDEKICLLNMDIQEFIAQRTKRIDGVTKKCKEDNLVLLPKENPYTDRAVKAWKQLQMNN